uniref:Variant surface glycoprotein 1125.2124 n=1 Tax=Trypanosoma brucei TaxID=5691 RepID=A0A1J0R840_9TRYP|nr:variant surface glycoprotein 1125.2124 [Trypanosoma brucei]
MVCLCADSAGTSTSCTGAAINTDLTYTNQATATTAFNALKPKCPRSAALKASEPTIVAAITQFLATLRAGQKSQHASQNILETAASAKCNAGVNSGCVLYKDTPESGILPVMWLTHLETAAAKLSQLARQQQENDKLLQRAKAHTQAAVQAYINTRNPRPETLAPAQPESKKQKTTENDCKKHQSKTDCKEPCEWDENVTDKSKEECKPKEEEEKKNTAGGAGETAKEGAVSAGCARHGTDKKACENDKTGDKQNCAWWKGKDNEPDLEKEMCRNGSLLVNNKMALSMDAGFVDLFF